MPKLSEPLLRNITITRFDLRSFSRWSAHKLIQCHVFYWQVKWTLGICPPKVAAAGLDPSIYLINVIPHTLRGVLHIRWSPSDTPPIHKLAYCDGNTMFVRDVLCRLVRCSKEIIAHCHCLTYIDNFQYYRTFNVRLEDLR